MGAPNAGKSTLLNALTGAKLSIVTPKPQTTRLRVLGILMRGESQILLIDTPGIFPPRRRLDRAMVAAAWTGARDADLSLLLVDAEPARPTRCARSRRSSARHSDAGRAGWCSTKSIWWRPRELLPMTRTMNALMPFEETFMVSALPVTARSAARSLARGDAGGPASVFPDDLTDLPDRLLAAEIVREQMFLQTHEEVPYAATVETEHWQERPNGCVRIDATSMYPAPVTRRSCRRKWRRIKAIGARARADWRDCWSVRCTCS